MPPKQDCLYYDFAEFYEPFYRQSLSSKKKGISFECDLLERLFENARLPVKSVLDVGCGTGIHSLELSKRGYLCTGFDLSPKMLEIAKSRDAQGKARFFQGNMMDFHFGFFDSAIAMTNVLNHCPNAQSVEAAVQRISGSLNAGGIAAFNFSDYLQFQKNGELAEEYTSEIEKDGAKITEFSKNEICEKTGVLNETNKYTITKGGKTVEKIFTGKLLLLSVAQVNALLEKSGLKPAGALDMETGKEATEKSCEILLAAAKK